MAHPPKECDWCGDEFVPGKFAGDRQRFCRTQCNKAYHRRAQYERDKEEGRCVKCRATEAVGESVMCAACLDVVAENGRRWREERREEGDCARCGHPMPKGMESGRVVCPGCVEEKRVYEATGEWSAHRERGRQGPPSAVEEALS